jgi:hypothetical protein
MEKIATRIKKVEGEKIFKITFKIKDKGIKVPIKTRKARRTKIILIINKDKEILITESQF